MRHFVCTDSGIIHSIGYDAKTFKLEIVFSTDTRYVYKYDSFYHDDYVRLMTAESVGEHFHKFIKNNPAAFTCVRVPISDELRVALKL